MTTFEKVVAIVCTLGAIWWIIVIISCIRDWVKAKIQQGKEKYAWERREVIVDTHSNAVERVKLRKEVNDLKEQLMGSRATVHKQWETITDLKVEIAQTKERVSEMQCKVIKGSFLTAEEVCQLLTSEQMLRNKVADLEKVLAAYNKSVPVGSATKCSPTPEPHTKKNI